MLTVQQVIQKSSNIGAARLAMRLTPKEQWEKFSSIGLGQKPQINFPGVVTGRLRPYKTWRPIEQATMAYGYGLSASLFQLARAYTVFANDGVLENVSMLRQAAPGPGPRVFKPETVKELLTMLQMVAAPGRHRARRRARWATASAASRAPPTRPRATATRRTSTARGSSAWRRSRIRASSCAVMIDEPAAGLHYGGDVAAPVFSQVVSQTLPLLGVAPDLDVRTQITQVNVVQTPENYDHAAHAPQVPRRRGPLAQVLGHRHAAHGQPRRAAGRRASSPGPATPTTAARFVASALAAGAATCLVEEKEVDAFGFEDARIATLKSMKNATGQIAAAFFDEPSQALKVVATTGTNGKTSTAWWTSQTLNLLGRRAGFVGTLGVGVPPLPLPVATGDSTQDWTIQRHRPDHARPGAAAGRVPPHGRRRLHGVRDRGQLDRHRRAAPGRHAHRGGAVHQLHARPPRLPRQHGQLLGRQAPAVRLGRA